MAVYQDKELFEAADAVERGSFTAPCPKCERNGIGRADTEYLYDGSGGVIGHILSYKFRCSNCDFHLGNSKTIALRERCRQRNP